MCIRDSAKPKRGHFQRAECTAPQRWRLPRRGSVFCRLALCACVARRQHRRCGQREPGPQRLATPVLVEAVGLIDGVAWFCLLYTSRCV